MTVCMLTPEFVFVLCRIVVFHVHQGVRSGYSYRDSHQMLLLLLLCCSAKGSRFKVWSRKSCEVLLRVWRRNGWVVTYDNPWIPLWSRGVMTQTWLEPFLYSFILINMPEFPSVDFFFHRYYLYLSQGLFSPQTELMTFTALLAPTGADVFFASPTPPLMLARFV